MATVLGLIGLVLFIVAVICLAAGVTYGVIKLTPRRKERGASTS
jgi:hypothetical protein